MRIQFYTEIEPFQDLVISHLLPISSPIKFTYGRGGKSEYFILKNKQTYLPWYLQRLPLQIYCEKKAQKILSRAFVS